MKHYSLLLFVTLDFFLCVGGTFLLSSHALRRWVTTGMLVD